MSKGVSYSHLSAKELIILGLAGTTAMTGYSSLAAKYHKQDLELPELLALLLKDILPARQARRYRIAGWCAHYTIGIFWAAVYQFIYQKIKVKPAILTGLTLGAFSGLIATASWKWLFKLHPKPPHTNMAEFTRQLFIAHLVYSITITLLFKHAHKRLAA